MDKPTFETPEQQELVAQIMALKEENHKRIASVEQYVPGGIQTAEAKADHHWTYLLSIGILTKEQFLQAELDWEQDLNQQVRGVQAEVRKRLEKMQRQQKLAVPQSARKPQGIHLPDGTIHLGQAQSEDTGG